VMSAVPVFHFLPASFPCAFFFSFWVSEDLTSLLLGQRFRSNRCRQPAFVWVASPPTTNVLVFFSLSLVLRRRHAVLESLLYEVFVTLFYFLPSRTLPAPRFDEPCRPPTLCRYRFFFAFSTVLSPFKARSSPISYRLPPVKKTLLIFRKFWLLHDH